MTTRTLSLAASALALCGAVLPLRAQMTTVATTSVVPNKTVVAVLRDAGHFTLFVQMVDAAGMRAQLEGPGPFTIFAPTDDALQRVPQGRRDTLLTDKAALERLIRNHLVNERLTAVEARSGRGRVFAGGARIRVDTSGPVTKVNGAQLLKGDLVGSNGVVHAIDQVWLPSVRQRAQGSVPATGLTRGRESGL